MSTRNSWGLLVAITIAACARTNTFPTDAPLEDGELPPGCAIEACNGLDDDCDGLSDESADESCAAPGWAGRCSDGTCSRSCAAGTANCDGEESNGCEVDTTSSRESCGACGRVCGITELCEAGVCRREHIVDFGAGENVCAVMETGRVLCWGPNDVGGNGDGTTEEQDLPVEVIGVRDAVRISTGTASCALTRDGDVWCWGYNETGVVAYPPSAWEPPTLRTDVHGVREVSVAGDVCVRLAPEDSVVCWGHRVAGAFDIFSDIAPAAEVVPGLRARRLGGAGGHYRFASTTEGEPVMWGFSGQHRQLDAESAPVWPPQPVSGIDDVDWIGVTGGRPDQCAIRRDGTGWCRSASTPWASAPLSAVSAIMDDDPHGLAAAGGDLWQWDTVSRDPGQPRFENLRRVELPGSFAASWKRTPMPPESRSVTSGIRCG